MYRKNQEHTVDLPLYDSANAPITTGTATVTISKDGGEFASTTNDLQPSHSPNWSITLTATEANCDGYSLVVTHPDMPYPVIYRDQAVGTVGDVTNDMDANSEKLETIDTNLAEIADSTGTGARTVTITITKDGSPVEGAAVRMSTTGDYRRPKNTDTNGQVVFRVDDETWTVAATYPLHEMDESDDNPLVVDDDKAVTYTLSAQTTTPSVAPFVTGTVTCYVAGVATAGILVDLALTKHDTDGVLPVQPAAGYWSETSGADGVATFSNVLLPGASYRARCGGGRWWPFNVPAAQTTAFELPRIVGVASS